MNSENTMKYNEKCRKIVKSLENMKNVMTAKYYQQFEKHSKMMKTQKFNWVFHQKILKK